MSLRTSILRCINLFASVLLLATALIPTGCRTESPPRGIILISADTLGAGHLGLYGYGPDTSPIIDRWAEDAIVFRNAFAQLPGTLPSHMSMMTGLSPRQHGVYPSSKKPVALSTDIPLLAEHLQRGGFRTAGFTEGGYVAEVFGFNRGFDQFEDRFKSWPDVLAAAGECIDSLEPDQPFFLFLHTYEVHDPYDPPEEHRAQFTPPPAPLSIKPRGSDLIAVNRGRKTISPDDLDQLRALYDAGVSYFDQQFGDLLEMMDRAGLDSSTMLILTADHGEEFMEHGRLAHETTYNPAIHVPLVIRVPQHQERRDIQSMVGLTDLPATILTWAGLPRSSFQGTDLLALAYADAEPDRSFAFSQSLVDHNRVVLGRVDGRQLKLMARRPQRSEEKVTCRQVSGLIVQNEEVTVRLRSFVHPHKSVKLSVYQDGVHLDTTDTGRKWSKRTFSFSGQKPHTLLFVVEGIVAGDAEGSSNDEQSLRIQVRSPGALAVPDIHLFDLDADPNEIQNVAADELDATNLLLRELAEHLVREKLVSPPELVIYSEKHRQRLKSLGYLE